MRETAALFVRVFQPSIAKGWSRKRARAHFKASRGLPCASRLPAHLPKVFASQWRKPRGPRSFACRRTTRSMFPHSTPMLERERAGLHDPGRHRACLQVNGARDYQPDPEVSVLGRFKTRDETVFTKGRTADQDGRCPDLRCDRKRLFAADGQNASQMPGLRIGKRSGALAIEWYASSTCLQPA